MNTRIPEFRRRLIDREAIIGTFIKTPSSIVAEVLGLSQLDVVAIDSEHAPFGRVEADLCIGAFRAADMPSLVRVADDSATQLRNALDSGANGVVVPHVVDPGQAGGTGGFDEAQVRQQGEPQEGRAPARRRPAGRSATRSGLPAAGFPR